MGIPLDFLDDDVNTPSERRCIGCGKRKPQSYLNADRLCKECSDNLDEDEEGNDGKPRS